MLKQIPLILLAIPLSTNCTFAVTVNLGAAKDSTIFDDATNNTSNGGGQAFFSGMNGEGTTTRGLIMFDIAAAVPTGAMITNATLTLHHNSPRDRGIETFHLHKLLADWGEENSVPSNDDTNLGGAFGTSALPGDATWAHRFFPNDFWSTSGGDFSSTRSASTTVNVNGSHDWSSAQLATDVQNWLDDPASNFGWILLNIDAAGDDGLAMRFDSRENSVSANRPVLTIDYSLSVDPDFDDDGDVDGDDLDDWATDYASGNGGDADGDGDTDGADYLAWQQQYTGPAGLQSATVPEPSSAALALGSLALAALNRRRGVRCRQNG